jgi:hypothetical protein
VPGSAEEPAGADFDLEYRRALRFASVCFRDAFRDFASCMVSFFSAGRFHFPHDAKNTPIEQANSKIRAELR